MTQVRKGQAPATLSREEFGERFRQLFFDPNFDRERDALGRVEEIAWHNYRDERKAPKTRKAGPGYADPDYDLSVDWLAAHERIERAQAAQRYATSPTRALVICGSPRNDGTCPGEMSKTFRLARDVQDTLVAEQIEVDFLDLSHLTSEYGRKIHPCKGCVSTAMPLCHWPCSCYPNHSLGQTNDWMHAIYPMWAAAHGVMIVTPVHWYQAPTVLKAMIDRLVCADGGNPDPTSTSGKDAQKAKDIEMKGWDYPRHLAGRAYAVVVHGDAAGAETLRRSLSDWLADMGLLSAGHEATIDRYVGYYEPYAENHQALDADRAFQEETRNAARALIKAVKLMRAGKLPQPSAGLPDPRPK